MAEIVLGIGTSHGTMLTTAPEQWSLRIPADQRGGLHFRGEVWGFDDLRHHRAGENIGEQVSLDAWRARHARCMRALDRLANVFEGARVDVAVIVGNDQMEIFEPSAIPAFSAFFGPEIAAREHTQAELDRMPPGIAAAMPGYTPDGGTTYRGEPALGTHIIEAAARAGFDVAAMAAMPKSKTPHAFGFVFRTIMQDRPPPSVPVLINTFYPPNQPTASRCRDFGVMLARAIRSWKSDARVAVIASGGLSHFVIDEQLDSAFLDAIRARDIDQVLKFEEKMYQGGSSELKNWIPVAALMAEMGFAPEVVDYVPCYRTEAGTGNAMGFVCWTPEAAS